MTACIRFDADGLPLQKFSCHADKPKKAKKASKAKELNTDCLLRRDYLSVDFKQIRSTCTHPYATFCRG